MTSWPMLTMQSAASMARCTKSWSDNAALPSHNGCSSSITPLPICVVKNGMPSLSISARSWRAVVLRLAPAPIISSGWRDCAMASTARSTALSSATGLRENEVGISFAEVSSPAMSCGSSRCVAPGRSSSARRKASRTRAGIASADTICRVYLVSGRIASTTSTIWKWPCRLVLIGFWPVIISIGMAPSCAYAAAVTRLVAPGPSVDRHTPALPVMRP